MCLCVCAVFGFNFINVERLLFKNFYFRCICSILSLWMKRKIHSSKKLLLAFFVCTKIYEKRLTLEYLTDFEFEVDGQSSRHPDSLNIKPNYARNRINCQTNEFLSNSDLHYLQRKYSKLPIWHSKKKTRIYIL